MSTEEITAGLPYHADRITVSAAQLAGWHGRQMGSALRLTGPCPACRHPLTLTVPLTTTSLEGFRVDEPVTTLTVAALCNCGRAHEGRPETPPHGCGRAWSATAQIEESGEITLAPADDPYLAEAAEALRAAETGRLERLRTAAEKWIAGVSALLGVLALLGVSLGADQIRKLSTAGRITVGVFVAAAVVAAALAILQAYRAAYGWPRTRSVSDDSELLTWYAAHREQPELVAARLRAAVITAGVALAALTVAGISSWLLPEATPAAPLVKVSTRGEAALCGTLLGSQADGTLRLRRADDGAVETVPLAGIARITVAKKC